MAGDQAGQVEAEGTFLSLLSFLRRGWQEESARLLGLERN